MGKIKIGLEVHVHLNTKEKLFCLCKIPNQNTKPNTTICPICTGQPGSKPKLPNKKALFDVLKLGSIMKCELVKKTHFQRKHYSWPDMPNGYQRTCSGPKAQPNCVEGTFLGIGIEGIHLEEDPASWNPKTGEINYNRAGFPLAEIVTKPEFDSVEKLESWLKELILSSKYLNVINEEFGIKSDVNVSIEESNFSRVEIKNVSSYTNIVKSAITEIKRQRELVKNGGKIGQETRRYDDELDETQFMRNKENAQDYRFIDEVDLQELNIDDKIIKDIESQIPELPIKKRQRYDKYDFDKDTIEVLVSNLYISEIFDKAIEKNLNPKEVGKFLRREILRILNYHNETFLDLKNKNIKNEIIKIIELLGQDKINYSTAKKVLEELYDNNVNVENYIKENNLFQIQDTNLITDLIKQGLKENEKALEDYNNGNEKSLNFIIGFVMNKTNRTAKPNVIQEKLKEVLRKLKK